MTTVPPGPEIVTARDPADELGGDTKVMLVADCDLIATESFPRSTELTAARFFPVMVTTVPPDAGPDVGATFVIVGARA